MTNKELLNANLLDIVFDNRNKEYGAYALRRDYNKRMLVSLGVGLSFILFLALFNSSGQKSENSVIDHPSDPTVRTVVIDITPPVVETPAPKKDLPKPAQPKSQPIATAAFTNIKIVPNEQVIKPVATKDDLDGKQIDTKDVAGVEETGKVIINDKPVGETGTGKEQAGVGSGFVGSYSDPEYPGGQEALSRFLSQNLATPNNLETGEKKMVRVRFKVDTDGAVTGFEIEQTAGSEYDKEVIRVCKKMRRWKPALQNGTAVPVSYVLPVTFIGIEQ